MRVGVVQQVLAPAVQHREEADLCDQVLGIGGDGAQRLGGGSEQKTVDERLVLIGDGCNGFRQREDDVKILRVERCQWAPKSRECGRQFSQLAGEGAR